MFRHSSKCTHFCCALLNKPPFEGKCSLLEHAASMFAWDSLSVSTVGSTGWELVKGFRLSEGSYINIKSTVSRCKGYSAQSQGIRYWKSCSCVIGWHFSASDLTQSQLKLLAFCNVCSVMNKINISLTLHRRSYHSISLWKVHCQGHCLCSKHQVGM